MLSSDTIADGEVVELSVVAGAGRVGATIRITVEARRGREVHIADVESAVTEPIESPDDRLVSGTEVRDAFLPWLMADHAELGITAETAWTALPFRPHIPLQDR